MCQSKSHAHGHHHHHDGRVHDHRPVPHGDEASKPSRREAMRRLGKAGLALAAAGSPWGSPVRAIADDAHPVSPGGASAKLFDLKKVAEGIYAAIARPTAMLNCNAAVVVNRDHVLIVDTHSKPSAAKALISQIRAEVTELPVRYVVDSHLHGDHAMGNEAYPEVFGPGVEMISSVKTREWLEKLGLPRLKASLDPLPKQIADFRARLEASKDESQRAVLRAQIEGLEEYLKEMTPPRVTLPTMTFDRRLVLHRGGREVHLMFLGRAHTAGDVVAYIPSERVVATGDLMHGLLPYMGDGFPDEWPATLRALEALEFDRVIPGHGSVQEGKSVLAEFRGYVEEVTEKVAAGVEQGRPLDELQKTVTPGSLKSLAGSGVRRRLERELGTLFTLEEPGAQVEGSVAGNVREVFAYFTQRKGNAEIPIE
jgi:glyoxylase-like metal-dependent hydrolase (beta-lactamase superfamily II)